MMKLHDGRYYGRGRDAKDWPDHVRSWLSVRVGVGYVAGPLARFRLGARAAELRAARFAIDRAARLAG